jgi:outer membrane protein assembly factor BamE
MKKLLILIVSILSALVTGCSNYIPAYKIDVQQGNILTNEDIDQIRIGMDKEKIQYILGSPTITDPFHANRWDYAYTFKPGYGKLEKKNISLYFERDILVKTSGSLEPDTSRSVDVSSYKKQQVITVNPTVKKKPGWIKRIWISFFGSEDEYELDD